MESGARFGQTPQPRSYLLVMAALYVGSMVTLRDSRQNRYIRRRISIGRITLKTTASGRVPRSEIYHTGIVLATAITLILREGIGKMYRARWICTWQVEGRHVCRLPRLGFQVELLGVVFSRIDNMLLRSCNGCHRFWWLFFLWNGFTIAFVKQSTLTCCNFVKQSIFIY